MRLLPILAACLAAAVAWAADAQDDTQDAQQALDRFEAELVRQCPEKQLQLLSARDLRDGLDSYLAGLPQDVRDRLQKAESDRCSTEDSGAACVNMADIMEADDEGRGAELATSICGFYLRCRDQGACDYAR